MMHGVIKNKISELCFLLVLVISTCAERKTYQFISLDDLPHTSQTTKMIYKTDNYIDPSSKNNLTQELGQQHSTTLFADSPIQCVIMMILFGLLITCSIIGNVFVIAAIYREKSLQNVANYLIVSLACADLMVTIMVMPIAAFIEISYEWTLGSIICDIWTSFDVLCCTASILHLVAIALDRYWAITNCNYGAKRTGKRIITMIVIIWVIATVMGVSPHLFGLGSLKESKSCHLTDNLTYQLVSTCFAFYLPLIFLCIIYWKIYQSAKFRIRKKQFHKKNNQTGNKKNDENSKKTLSVRNNSLKSKEESKNHSFENEKTSAPSNNENSIQNNVLNNKKNEYKQEPYHVISLNNISKTNTALLTSSSSTGSPPLPQQQNSPKLRKFVFRNKLLFHYIFSMKKPKGTSCGMNYYGVKGGGSNHQLDHYNNNSITMYNESLDDNNEKLDNNSINSIKNENENEISDDNQNENVTLTSNEINKNPNESTLNEIDQNSNEIDQKLNKNRSHSFKSFLNNHEDRKKTLKIRMPFVFSESNLPQSGCRVTGLHKVQMPKSKSYVHKSSSLLIKNEEKILNTSNQRTSEEEPNLNAPVESNIKITKPELEELIENKSIERVAPPIMPKYNNNNKKKSLKKNYIPANFDNSSMQTSVATTHSQVDIHVIRKKQAKIDMKRERKAAKTLGVIMSCFIICWLPFFFMQLFFSVCKDCYLTKTLIDSPLVTILLWLGYLNSLLNPCIYTIFSPDFRNAFSKILFGNRNRKKKYKF